MSTSANLVGRKDVLSTLKICKTTLYKLVEDGKIEVVKIGNKKWLYNLDKYLLSSGVTSVIERKKICYCRVSSEKQKGDLQHQIEMMERLYPNHTIIKDIGSGLNFKRKGLIKILEYSLRCEIDELVIAYKDRLARFGYDIFKFLIENFSRGRIIVLNNLEERTPMEEVCEDILSIMNVYVAKINGLRKYRTKIKKDFEDENFKVRKG